MLISDVKRGYYYNIVTPHFSGACKVVGVSKVKNTIKVEYLVNGGVDVRVLPIESIKGISLLGGKDFAYIAGKGKLSVGNIIDCGQYGRRKVKKICHFYGGCMVEFPEAEDGEAFTRYDRIVNIIGK